MCKDPPPPLVLVIRNLKYLIFCPTFGVDFELSKLDVSVILYKKKRYGEVEKLTKYFIKLIN